MNKTDFIYIALLLLTTLTFFLGASEDSTLTFLVFVPTVVLLTTFIKGLLISDYFMELKNVDFKYRLFIICWLVLVILLIALAHFNPATNP